MQPKKKMEVNDVIIGILILFGYCLQSCKVVLIDFQDIYMLGIISEFSLRFLENPILYFNFHMTWICRLQNYFIHVPVLFC